ncbi:PAS domain-containing sensor histidine kinase [Flagellimonas meishanensis]|uniref:PAS domain-containing sensor histidine kinase n=1 Tax=Flagellimonas meishanensis TaxID=2873264 RepID=UPI001CA6F2FE|nr:PAS domain-containing sensor histidine kinase [[Muricauda] meishanensis]
MKAAQTITPDYLLKQLPKATALVNRKQLLAGASDSWLNLFGKGKKSMIGQDVKTLFASHEQIDLNALDNLLCNGESGFLRHKTTMDNTTRWFQSTFSPWFDDKENVLGTIIQTDDITEHVETRHELDRIKTLFKEKSEVARVGCWEYDIATEELFWCEETKKIHEVSPGYIPNVNEGINYYKKGYSRNKISMLFHKALEEGKAFSERLEILTSKGNEKWVKASGKPIVQDGSVVKLFGTFQDIHEQVMLEIKREENERLLTTLINNIPLNVFVKDKDSRKTLVNKSECDYLEKSQEDLIGKDDFDLYDAKAAQISREEDLEVMRTLKPLIGKETISIKKDGRTTNFLTSKIPLLDLEGNVNGLIGISMDITSLKKKEDQLRNLINVTAVQNKKLINFAHIVSHNLRSHSANFSMLLNFLEQEDNESEKKHLLKMLAQASDNLMLTLEDLNEVVTINTNVNLQKKLLNLNEVVDKVLQDLSTMLKKNRVEIINTVPKNKKVLSVPSYLESILLNLITNAIKYRDPERNPIIKIRAAKEKDKTLVQISDNGLGIDLKKHGRKVFGMYKTFHDKKDAKGLGLYIIKNQIEGMGGAITVQSEEGVGTTFNIYFNEENR